MGPVGSGSAATPTLLFGRVPGCMLLPFVEIGFGAQGQIGKPRGLKGGASSLKADGGATALLARTAARIEPAIPFPRI